MIERFLPHKWEMFSRKRFPPAPLVLLEGPAIPSVTLSSLAATLGSFGHLGSIFWAQVKQVKSPVMGTSAGGQGARSEVNQKAH